MAKTYIWKRVIPEEECPGTCCRAAAGHLFKIAASGFCEHHDATMDPATRKFGGCSIRDDTRRAAARLTPRQERAFQSGCVTPFVQLDVIRNEKQMKRDNDMELESWCDCFRKEEV